MENAFVDNVEGPAGFLSQSNLLTGDLTRATDISGLDFSPRRYSQYRASLIGCEADSLCARQAQGLVNQLRGFSVLLQVRLLRAVAPFVS